MARPLPRLLKIISAGGDMTHLATRAYLLAIQLYPEPPVTGEAVQQRGSKIIDAAAEDVRHDRPCLLAAWVTKRKVEDGTQVIFELRGVRAIDRPVARVVRTHCELVHNH